MAQSVKASAQSLCQNSHRFEFQMYRCLPCTVSVRYHIQITLFIIDSDRRKIQIGYVKMQNINSVYCLKTDSEPPFKKMKHPS